MTRSESAAAWPLRARVARLPLALVLLAFLLLALLPWAARVTGFAGVAAAAPLVAFAGILAAIWGAHRVGRQVQKASRAAAAAGQGTRLLSSASALLASSLDYQDTLRSVARLAVPALADWCAVHVLEEDGSLERLVVANPDPKQEGLAGRLQERHKPNPASPRGIYSVLRTGRSELYSEIPESLIRDLASDEPQLRMIEELRLTSAMTVPISARGRTLGTLTFLSAESGRRYGADELALAEELGRRAGVAVDNARLYEEATGASRAKDAFLAIISHELRTPLNAILGYTDLLRMELAGPLTFRQQEHLTRVTGSAMQLLQLIEEILGYAKMETARGDVWPERVEAGDLAKQAAATIQPLVNEKRLLLHVEIPRDVVYFETDPYKVRQILVNLLTNAVKFTSEGEIAIEAQAVGDEVAFHVRDTGLGIPRTHLERIFEPFWQVEEATTRKVGGAGLGLSVARRLARLLGGDVTAESEPGQGSTFSLSLPRRWQGGTQAVPARPPARVAEASPAD